MRGEPLKDKRGKYSNFDFPGVRDEDPIFFSTDPDPAKLEKYSGSDLKSK